MSRAGLDRRPAAVAAMFDAVAPRYDRVNDLLSLGQDRWWRRVTTRTAAPRVGQLVLDAAAGTGTSAVPLAAAGASVVACDFSLGMLRLAAARRRPGVRPVAADAGRLPFADARFDAVTMSFGLRNTADPDAVLTELRRVTRTGGRLVICEFAVPTGPVFRRLYLPYLRRVLPRLAGLAASNPQAYRYLAESILDWPTPGVLADRIRRAGWAAVRWRSLSGGTVVVHRARAAGPGRH